MAAVTFFKTYVVGGDQPIGRSLIRLLDAQEMMYQDYSFGSVATIKKSTIESTFMVICPSVYDLTVLQGLDKWLKQAEQLDIPVLFVSTLAVFSKEESKSWIESDEGYANSEIAEAFIEAERKVAQLSKYFILRAGLPLYLDGNDFASRFLEAVRQGKSLELNNTEVFNPTASNDLAQVIMAMLQQANCADNLWGIYHYNGAEAVNSFQFGQALLELARHNEDIPPVVITAVEQGGEKPKIFMASGNNTKIFYTFGIHQKAWRQSLSRLFRALARAH